MSEDSDEGQQDGPTTFEDLKLKLHRSEDGRLKTLKGVTPTLGMDIEILPLTYGQSKSFESFGKPLMQWTDEEKCRLINECVETVEGVEWQDIDVDEMEDDFDPWTINDLIQAVAVYSGMGRLFEADDGAGKEPALS